MQPMEPKIERYRPWPLAVLAGLMGCGGAFYAYDLALFVHTGSMRLPVAIAFVAGIIVSFGMAWGLWRMDAWARVVMIWLCILIIGGTFFVLPFILLFRPAGTVINLDTLAPILIFVGGCVVIVRYLSREDTRRAFEP